MDTVILPTLTYDAETWALMKDQSRKLATSQRRMERSILNISLKDKIRNETIRERTKVKDVLETVRDLKSRWARHVARMEDKRLAKITTEWYPRGCKKTRGKPKRRWRDEIEEKVGNNWMRVALDRVAWRQLWRPSASCGVTG